ncbi:MAG: GFA family protein [Pseudorhodoferax sp.]
MNASSAIHRGSCLCGAVQFALASDPKAAAHCHCRMCQKQHGAAFATYASVPRGDLRYLAGEDQLTAYRSSAHILRRFCRVCGSSIEWGGSPTHPDWVSIPLATLDTPFRPARIRDVHLASRAGWLAAAPAAPPPS